MICFLKLVHFLKLGTFLSHDLRSNQTICFGNPMPAKLPREAWTTFNKKVLVPEIGKGVRKLRDARQIFKELDKIDL